MLRSYVTPYLPCPHSHFSHSVRQVGRDGCQPLATTVHNAVAAGAHGRAGTRWKTADLGPGSIILACRERGTSKNLSSNSYIGLCPSLAPQGIISSTYILFAYKYCKRYLFEQCALADLSKDMIMPRAQSYLGLMLIDPMICPVRS